MRFITLSFLLATAAIIKTTAQNPTIYLSDYSVKEHKHDPPPDLEGENLFSHIFFYEKEIYEGGFREKITTFYNEDLLLQLKGHEIFFNTNFIFQYDLPGFYKNKSLKSTYSVDSKAGKAFNGAPNIFYVKDLLFDETNVLQALILNKVKDEKREDLYFSVKDFVSGSKVAAGTLADLGLIDMEYIKYLNKKHQNQTYVLAFHDGRTVSIPQNTDTPNTIANRTLSEVKKLNKTKTVSSAMMITGLTAGSATWGYAGLLLSVSAQNSFKEQQRKMEEFRAKQRQLLYNFDLISNTYLSKEDFGPEVSWKFKDVKILEDSGSPVLLLENAKGQQVLALEDLSDMYLTSEKINEWSAQYGKDSFLRLFDKDHTKGLPLEMIRFSMGYPNYLASAAEKDGYYEEVYAFGKEWYYFRDGIYGSKEWKNFRPEMEKFDQQQISQEQ